MQLSLPVFANAPPASFVAADGSAEIRPSVKFPASLSHRQRAGKKPRFVRSCVVDAGFGRFVYLTGKSGRRYVFSSIKAEQAALYSRGLFAIADERDGVRLLRNGEKPDADRLYVHLLDEGDDAEARTMADLDGVAG